MCFFFSVSKHIVLLCNTDTSSYRQSLCIVTQYVFEVKTKKVCLSHQTNLKTGKCKKNLKKSSMDWNKWVQTSINMSEKGEDLFSCCTKWNHVKCSERLYLKLTKPLLTENLFGFILHKNVKQHASTNTEPGNGLTKHRLKHFLHRLVVL